MSKKNIFPKELYVIRANVGSPEEYLSADPVVEKLLEANEPPRTIARYVLVETCVGWLSPEIRNIRKVRHRTGTEG